MLLHQEKCFAFGIQVPTASRLCCQMHVEMLAPLVFLWTVLPALLHAQRVLGALTTIPAIDPVAETGKYNRLIFAAYQALLPQ